MNKRVYMLFFLVMIIIFPINVVFADCGDYEQAIANYDAYKEKLENLDCNDTTDETAVIACNDYKLDKNLIVEELMKAKEENKVCDSQEARVDEIIEENKDNCSKIFDDDFSKFINRAMIIFYVLGPILLILFGSLDYAKAVVATNEAEIKKAHQRFFKRMVATILIFLAPAITNFIISFNISDYYLSGNGYSCNYEYKVYSKKWTIKYTPKQKKKKGGKSSANGGNKVGDYILFGQSDPAWGDEMLIASGSTTIRSAGCALTSVAMAIVNSGVETVEPINPSSLSKILARNGYYACDCNCCIGWGGTSAATNGHLVYVDQPDLTGTIDNKATQLAEWLNEGYHIVIQVKWGTDDSSHYVYVLYVDNGNIMVGESWDGTLLNLNASSYPIAGGNYSSQAIRYKVVE